MAVVGEKRAHAWGRGQDGGTGEQGRHREESREAFAPVERRLRVEHPADAGESRFPARAQRESGTRPVRRSRRAPSRTAPPV